MLDPIDLVARKAIVRHLQRGVIGRVRHFYDGRESIYMSPMPDGSVKPLEASALEFESGHVFVWKPDAFFEVSELVGAFYVLACDTLTHMLGQLAVEAIGKGLSQQEFGFIVASVCRDQSAAFATVLRQADPSLSFG